MAEIGDNGGPPLEDNREGNWFAVSREIFDHSIVGIHGRAYTELEAWLSLLAMAQYDERRVMNKGTVVVLDPGQLMAAHGFLAKRWEWTVDKVRWFLQRLSREAMITRYCTMQDTSRRTNQIQIITICNYRRYQATDRGEHQSPRQAEPHPNTKPAPSEHQANTNNLTLKHSNKETIEVKEEAAPLAGERLPALFDPALLPPPAERNTDALTVLETYNDLAQRVGLPMATGLTPKRRTAINARLREHGGYVAWESILNNIARSAFLQGRNDRGWRPGGLDWFLKPDNFVKVLEGAYGNGAHAKEGSTARTMRLVREAAERMGIAEDRS